ncbi:ABC transporter permease [Nitratidesulfovibrio sp. SRB-5]|uniref:ABC transporter permease n=1 Tax=Nitratidesulfovibrio sp. SRB-5 TaxID=2872636 RepID=UPI001024CFB7|nr:ABC transporter permease [Nitratidesulfovibrio sp. SRB-5]MBZ2170876.1 ABC transporter permease [Nitratidesulfovibrio sp. SRB-5]RXF78126.1 ABC transporter permease [Desulfovibrio sp. DS-1]
MPHELVIEAGRAERQYWKDLWRYRELFLILMWRDVAVQYKQTVVGILWAVLRPLLTMAAFTFVFGKVAKLPSEGGVPYPLMVFVAMLPWQLFATSLAATANSLVSNSNLVSKVYFPRIIVPAGTMGVALVDYAISFLLLGGMMAWYQYAPPLQILAAIPLTMLAAIVALGPGLILCALNVTYRDFRIIVPFITQFGLYVSPVGFSSGIVPEKWRILYECNPMVGVIDGFRWAMLGSIEFPARALCISMICAFICMLLGIKIFRKTERTFADVI